MDLLKISKTHVYILPKANHAEIFKKSPQAYEGTGSIAFAIATAHTRRHSHLKHLQTLPSPRTAGGSHHKHENFEPSGEGGEGGGSRGTGQERPSGTWEAPQPHAHLPHGNLRKSLQEPVSAQPRQGQRWDRGEDSTCPAPQLPATACPAPWPREVGGEKIQQNKTRKGEVVRFGVRLRARRRCETGRHGTDSGPPARLCKARPPRRRGSPAPLADTPGAGQQRLPARPRRHRSPLRRHLSCERDPCPEGARGHLPLPPAPGVPQHRTSPAEPPRLPRRGGRDAGSHGQGEEKQAQRLCPPSVAAGEPLALPPLSRSTTTTNTAERSAACGAGRAPGPPVVGRPGCPSPLREAARRERN